MTELANFSESKYTAIISDLHLCEAEPSHPKFPLWKKFKTREFFFDQAFASFLEHIQEKADGEKVELVLNGDIFDFDSVTSIPEAPTYRVSWLERARGLKPRPERSQYKIQAILKDHDVFFKAMSQFIQNENRVIFVIGNHDLELHFEEVQREIINYLKIPARLNYLVRFADWFYISNADTLIEHGNQYDAYCVCEDPINPFSQGYNYKTIKLPFGNLACRYLMNGMGFFNPHVDSNYIMSMPEYLRFFMKYVARAQPELVLTWLWGAIFTLWGSFRDRLDRQIKDPMKIEDRVNRIARRANAEPRMVREMRELIVPSASENPFLIAKELWLDRAFLIFIAFIGIFEIMILIRQIFDVSFFWAFIPLFIFLPFFMFYSKSITSMVSSYKEPDERILSRAAAITKTTRIVFGHTHITRHEVIGAVEHLNCGTWSPAFLDVECRKAVDQKHFVWIEPDEDQANLRTAQLLMYKEGMSAEAPTTGRKRTKKSVPAVKKRRRKTDPKPDLKPAE
jgi:UDP-2,3-diacylglucosamine pyrophosphatase LpxH